MSENALIVPFGKYKGKPVEAMAQDRAYVEWLSQQPWFREKFSNLYQTVIVNNFGEPSETPEHNALQVLFLDDAFCAAFIATASPDFDADRKAGAARVWSGGKWAKPASVSLRWQREFECNGVDVVLSITAAVKEDDSERSSVYTEKLKTWTIEIKPTIGDDYPAVLRQMRANHSTYLFVESFSATGATRDQFVKTFEASGMKVIFRDEVER